jgi:ABC-type sugar transport system substrate-binding protein
VKVIATGVDDDLSPAKALDVATSLLSANPSVKGIMSSTDNISVGVIQAMEGLGIDPATVATAGWDAQADAVKLVTEGKYTLTLSYLAYTWGEVALQTAVDMVNGKMPASHYVTTPGLFIDKANASTLTPDQISGKTAL